MTAVNKCVRYIVFFTKKRHMDHDVHWRYISGKDDDGIWERIISSMFGIASDFGNAFVDFFDTPL